VTSTRTWHESDFEFCSRSLFDVRLKIQDLEATCSAYVSGIHPYSGPINGNSYVTIFGGDFEDDYGAYSVQVVFDEDSLTTEVGVTYGNASSLSFHTPSMVSLFTSLNNSSKLAVKIQLLEYGKSIDFSFMFYFYGSPTVTEVSPATISAYRSAILSLHGIFEAPLEQARVYLRSPYLSEQTFDAVYSIDSKPTLSVNIGNCNLPADVYSAEVEVYLAINGVDFTFTHQVINVTKAIGPMKVCFMFFNDLSVGYGWTRATANGQLALHEEFGLRIETHLTFNVRSNTHVLAVARGYVEQGCELIIATYLSARTIYQAVPANSSVALVIYGELPAPQYNVATCALKSYEPRYLAGMTAAHMSVSNVLGYVIGQRVPQTVRELNAFTLGAQKVKSDIRVVVYFTEDFNSYDTDLYIGRIMLKLGVDVVTIHTNGVKLHTLFHQHELYSTGHVVDLGSVYGDRVLVSSLNLWGSCYIEHTQQVSSGSFVANQNFFKGIRGGGTDISSLSWRVPQQVQAEIYDQRSMFFSGFEVFCGPIHDTKGDLVVEKGRCLSNEEVGSSHSMDWLAAGVENRGVTTLPNCGSGNYSRLDDTLEFVACEVCPAGSFSGDEDVLECELCPAGTFSTAGVCTRCPDGSYSPDPGASFCLQCPPGYFRDREGYDACLPCRPGFYTEDFGSVTCTACLPSQFNPEYAAESCQECPEFSSSLSSASTTINNCVCKEGFFSKLNTSRPPCGACPNVETVVTTTSTRRGEVKTSVCERLRTCGVMEERSTLTIRVTHSILEFNLTALGQEECDDVLAYLDKPVTGLQDDDTEAFNFSLVETRDLYRVYEMNVTHEEFGAFALDVFVDGVVHVSSPTFVELVEFGCPVSQTVKAGPSGLYCEVAANSTVIINQSMGGGEVRLCSPSCSLPWRRS